MLLVGADGPIGVFGPVECDKAMKEGNVVVMVMVKVGAANNFTGRNFKCSPFVFVETSNFPVDYLIELEFCLFYPWAALAGS